MEEVSFIFKMVKYSKVLGKMDKKMDKDNLILLVI
jgi:hypothetical protein